MALVVSVTMGKCSTDLLKNVEMHFVSNKTGQLF